MERSILVTTSRVLFAIACIVAITTAASSCEYQGSLAGVQCTDDADCDAPDARCIDDYCVYVDAATDHDVNDECQPDSERQLCEDHISQCGSFVGEDNCGQQRDIDCEQFDEFGCEDDLDCADDTCVCPCEIDGGCQAEGDTADDNPCMVCDPERATDEYSPADDGIVCSDNAVCSAGDCVCDDGYTDCDGDCVDTDISDHHCGSCGNQCTTEIAGAESFCDGDGGCQPECIDADHSLCEDAEVCTDTDSDVDHCGECGVSCGANELCDGGDCVCVGGYTDCDGICIDTDADADNCGSCGNECGDLEVCSAGSCDDDCPAGETVCDASCIDTDISDDHCGSCGNECTGCQTCDDGQCVDDPSQCSGCEDCDGGSCVDDSAQCSGTDNICDNATCVECTGDGDCSGCQECSSGSCVDSDSNCSGCEECSSGSCVDDSSQCSGTDDICDNATCVECTEDTDCASNEECSSGACIDPSTCDPNATPFGSPSQPYLLCDPQHVLNIEDEPHADFEIYDDLAGGTIDFGSQPALDESLGTFSGTLDGNGHAIDGLVVDDASTTNVGLFSELDDATVQSLTLSNIDVTGGDTVGALAGTNNGTVDDVTADGTVRSDGNDVGGLVGVNNGTIDRSGADVDITGDGDTPGSEIGGLVGINAGSIDRSYASGAIEGTEHVGGFVGSTSTDIADSYATGDVTGTSSIGGFAGEIGAPNGDVSDSYAYGEVNGDNNPGFVGDPKGPSPVNDCYYNDVNNDDDSDAEPLTADADGFGSESSFSAGPADGWDFENIWTMLDDVADDDVRPVHAPN